MRINFSNPIKLKKGIQAKVLKELITLFATEHQITKDVAVVYIKGGLEGTEEFAMFLRSIGFQCQHYSLRPNTVKFERNATFRLDSDPDDEFDDMGQLDEDYWTPSFGIVIPDDDPKLVELKLKA